MNVSKQAIDNSIFEGFTPLCDLDANTLNKLARLTTIESVPAGNFLFERGDTTQRTFYLLEGNIELCSPLFPTFRRFSVSQHDVIYREFPRIFERRTCR